MDLEAMVLRPLEKRVRAAKIEVNQSGSMALGAALTAFGCAVLGLVLWSVFKAPGTVHGNTLVGVLVPLCFILIGVGQLTYRDRACLDPDRRAWSVEQGFYPFAVAQTGFFDEFSVIRFGEFSRKGRKGRTYTVWSAELEWKHTEHKTIKSAPFACTFLDMPVSVVSRERALAVAEEFSKRVGIPLECYEAGVAI